MSKKYVRLTHKNNMGDWVVNNTPNCTITTTYYAPNHSCFKGEPIDRLAEFEDDIESGKLVRFPRIVELVKGKEWVVEYLYAGHNGSGIGKCFCDTKEDALEELKRLEDDNG